VAVVAWAAVVAAPVAAVGVATLAAATLKTNATPATFRGNDLRIRMPG